ncbi:MAG: hypothetical protein IJ802_05520 [Kiritimatiellae bacterium]|nr:hypothetical protein [Kiritimatiellia bacterium]
MELHQAFDLISTAARRGKMPNAYLFVGRLAGDAHRLALKTLGLFFPSHVEDRLNPDIHWLFPEKKSRVISVDDVRTKLVNPVAQTAFGNGWKAGVVAGAECFNAASANAFLKTLEEPPPKTFFLLLAESAENLLPTIISRCQRIDLADAGARGLEPRLAAEVARILDGAAGSWTARAGAAAKLAQFLQRLKDAVEEEVAAEIKASGNGPGEEISDDEGEARVSSRYRAVRKDCMITMVEYFRRVMDEAATSAKPALSLAAAFANIGHIEDATKRLDARNMNELAVLGQLLDLLQFPKK